MEGDEMTTRQKLIIEHKRADAKATGYIIMTMLYLWLIYAGIWPLAIRNLGRFTNIGSSLLVMGLCGNAILPLIYGAIADSLSFRMGYWVLVPCFLYMIFYATYGHKIEHWRGAGK